MQLLQVYFWCRSYFSLLSLFKLGLGSHEVAANAANGAVILHAYVQHAFGIWVHYS
jgi:branched-subunit amino acid permease